MGITPSIGNPQNGPQKEFLCSSKPLCEEMGFWMMFKNQILVAFSGNLILLMILSPQLFGGKFWVDDCLVDLFQWVGRKSTKGHTFCRYRIAVLHSASQTSSDVTSADVKRGDFVPRLGSGTISGWWIIFLQRCIWHIRIKFIFLYIALLMEEIRLITWDVQDAVLG